MNKRQKKKLIKMKNKKLVKEYPFLAPKDYLTGKIDKEYDYSYTIYDWLPYGWKLGFGKFLLKDLKDACIKEKALNKLQIYQLKEKYGTMRMYANPVSKEINDIIRKYEFISSYICIECGSPYAAMTNFGGWYIPMCESCWNSKNRQRLKGGYKEINWEDVTSEKYKNIPNELKYTTFSLNGNHTITVDISNIVTKIKNNYHKRFKGGKNET